MTSKMKKLGFAALTAGLLAGAANAEPNRLVIFGDSLSDTGQFFDPVAKLGANIEQPLRWTTRVSDLNAVSAPANVWVDYLSLGLGLGAVQPTLPYLPGVAVGDNYAVAGQTTDFVKSSITDASGNMVPDVDLVFGPNTDFLAKDFVFGDGYLVKEPVADANAVFAVWAGGNDVRALRSNGALSDADRATASQAAAQNIVDGVQALVDAGAQNVLVGNLPDMGLIPESGVLNLRAEGSASSDAFNETLRLGLASMGSQVTQLNMEALLATVQGSPEKFGFSAEDHTTVAFDGTAFTTIQAQEGVNGKQAGGNADSSLYVFFDGIHPSSAMHEIIGDYALSVLAGPTEFAPLAELGLSVVSQPEAALASEIRRGRGMADGSWRAYVVGSTGNFEQDAEGSNVEIDEDSTAISVGVEHAVSDTMRVGLSLSMVNGDADLGTNTEVDVESHQLRLHGAWDFTSGYIVWTAGYGDQEYDVDRRVSLGSAAFVNRGNTEGQYLTTGLEIGANAWERGKLSVTPYASLTYRQNEVDGFVESGEEATRYGISDLEREALSIKLGLDGEYALPTEREGAVFAGLSVEHDFLADNDTVQAELASLAGSRYTASAYDAEDTVFSANLGVRYQLTDALDASIGIDYRVGDSVDSFGGRAALGFAF